MVRNRGKSGPALGGMEYRLMPSACRLIVRAYRGKSGPESCTNAKAKYSSSVVPPDPSVHFYHWSQMTSIDTVTQWREDWSSASVLNHTTVTDPTIRQPGFHLPRHTWSLMNHFQTGQGPCRANLHKWGLAQSPSCDCGQ